MADTFPVEWSRSCDGCTACCQGKLSGQVYGIPFHAGRPCHFVGNSGCSIYEKRPDSPCKLYSCAWLNDKILPEWMKPNRSGVLITQREYIRSGGVKSPYWDVTELEAKIDSVVLNWLLSFHVKTQLPMRIQVDRGFHFYGPEDFNPTTTTGPTA